MRKLIIDMNEKIGYPPSVLATRADLGLTTQGSGLDVDNYQ